MFAILFVVPCIYGIANILYKKRISVAFSPTNTLRKLLDHAKDPLDPKKGKGVYSIPCDCGKVYIGETGRSVYIRLKEHTADIIHGRSIFFPLQNI